MLVFIRNDASDPSEAFFFWSFEHTKPCIFNSSERMFP